MKVFTNGCFDILHLGHVKLLEYCYDLAHKSTGGPGQVIVGVNSDYSVRKLKGGTRPVNNEEARVCVLEALRYVDDVIVFDGDTPRDLIEDIDPDVIVKDASKRSYMIEEGEGYRVEYCPFVGGYSTTNILHESTSNRR